LPGRRVAEVIWLRVCQAARLAVQRYPFKNSNIHVGLAQFLLEADEARGFNAAPSSGAQGVRSPKNVVVGKSGEQP